MKIKIKNIANKAFSIAETMLMLSVIGIIMVFLAKSMSKVSMDSDLAKFKKAYSGIEDTISYLINDEVIYGTSSGFKDTDSVTIDKVGQIIGQNASEKFRDAFKYHMHYIEDDINCPIYSGSSTSGCFRTDYGVVFGIPNTDFVKMGTVETRDFDNQKITAVPITFYTNYKDGQTVDDNAFIVNITYDGKIYFGYSIDKSKCTKSSSNMQCKLKKYVHATSAKKSLLE